MNGPDDVDAMVAAIRAEIDKLEAVARAASPQAPAGESWRWECSHCDTPAVLDPVQDEYLECRGCEGYTFSLRSVEEYPSSYVGSLPTFVLASAEEVSTTGAMLVVRNDSATVLRRCVSDRRLLAWLDDARGQRCGVAEGYMAAVVRELADFYVGSGGVACATG